MRYLFFGLFVLGTHSACREVPSRAQNNTTIGAKNPRTPLGQPQQRAEGEGLLIHPTLTQAQRQMPALSKTPSATQTHGTRPVNNSVQDNQAGRIRGVVRETMDAGGYTYASVATASNATVWMAGPPTTLSAGDSINIERSTVMTNFTSKTLNRTFDRIYFVSTFGATSVNKPPHHTRTRAETRDENTVQPSTFSNKLTPDGATPPTFSVEQLHQSAKTLQGRTVRVRGTVVKFNAGILGKNWVHLQDGTGEASLRTNDITITTQATPSVGSTVVAYAVVQTNRDFGAGYSYAIILENGRFTLENSTKTAP